MLCKHIKIILTIGMLLGLSACSTTKSTSSETEDKNKKISTAKINTQLGIAYLEQHNIPRAKRKFLLALDEAPNIPDTWYTMGYFLEVTGDKEQAKKYYLKSIALAPQRGDVQNNFGTFLCRSGEYQAAIEHFKLATKDINYVDTAGAYENAALCALKIPNKQLALLYFNKTMEQDPDRPSVYLELADLNYKEGKYRLSKQNLDRFLQLSPPNKTSFELSDQLEKKLGDAFIIEKI
jgi:type IV pilus assembly protein PilF